MQSFFSAIKLDENNLEQIIPEFMFQNMAILFTFQFITFASALAVLIYYLLDIYQYNEKFKNSTNNEKLIWTLIVIFGSFVGTIAYYIVEVLPRNETTV